LLLGIISPTDGEVLYRGKSLQEMSRQEWTEFRRNVQAIFQDPFAAFNPFYRVDHVLTLPIAKYSLSKSKSEGRDLIEQALQGVGLRSEETLGRYPHQLSGGQRQRIMIARALLLNPRIIVADEPVSMVDASLRAAILESLLKLNKDFGISLIYITHDLATAYQLCETIVILYQGSVAEVGFVERVITNPQHPYTQLLVGSIPLPDPDVSWAEDEDQGGFGDDASGGRHGCKFADRCPQVMDRCLDAQPPLFRIDVQHAAACYLYEDYPTADTTDIIKPES
jgi:oligopeptide/dipeptide ABC transporter ATP-binding protein